MQVTKGMRDFYPEEYKLREWLFDKFRGAASRSGFQFYDCPILESEELYIRKAGEEITDQLYTLQDKSGRALALRPEMTPSLARMVIQRFKELPSVIKWSSIPQCFRYERMTRGRKREHYQWNLDYLGEASMIAEAEVIATALHAIESMSLGPQEVKIRMSNRRLLADMILALGVSDEQVNAVFMQIDKLGKISDDQLIQNMIDNCSVSIDIGKKILEMIRISKLSEVSDYAKQLNADLTGLDQLDELFSLLQDYGFGEYLQFDFSIVRGLAYYTGTVFELFDAGKGLRAIAGGGRYDHLIQHLANGDSSTKSKGAVSKEAVGLGFGDVVILELLKDHNKLPELPSELDCYLLPFDNDDVAFLMPILRELRQNGLSAQMHYPPQKPRKMFARANQLNAKHALIAGSLERESGTVKWKDFKTGDESTLSIDEITSKLVM